MTCRHAIFLTNPVIVFFAVSYYFLKSFSVIRFIVPQSSRCAQMTVLMHLVVLTEVSRIFFLDASWIFLDAFWMHPGFFWMCPGFFWMCWLLQNGDSYLITAYCVLSFAWPNFTKSFTNPCRAVKVRLHDSIECNERYFIGEHLCVWVMSRRFFLWLMRYNCVCFVPVAFAIMRTFHCVSVVGSSSC